MIGLLGGLLIWLAQETGRAAVAHDHRLEVALVGLFGALHAYAAGDNLWEIMKRGEAAACLAGRWCRWSPVRGARGPGRSLRRLRRSVSRLPLRFRGRAGPDRLARIRARVEPSQ
jgi:hypothetical protein